jgi:hypothetical protein
MWTRRRHAEPPRTDPDRVDLLIAGVGNLVAIVRRAHDGVADLDLKPPIAAGFLDGRDATLVAMGDRRIEGVLEVGWARGHVRFIRRDIQRRAWTRASVEHPAVLLTERLDSIWRVRTVDLSAGGALVNDADTLPLGARLEVHVQVEEGDDVRAPGRVVRAPSPALRAVRFEALDDAERLRLARLVALEHVRRLGGDGPV